MSHFYFMLTSHSLRQNLDYIQDAGFTAGTYNFTHNHRDIYLTWYFSLDKSRFPKL